MKTIELIKDKDIIGSLEKAIAEKNEKDLSYYMSEKRMKMPVDEIYDTVQSSLDLDNERLEEIKKLKGESVEKQKKYIKLIDYIEEQPLNYNDLLDVVLAAGVIISTCDNDVVNLSDEDLFLVSVALKHAPVEVYNLFKPTIDQEVLEFINELSPDYYDRLREYNTLLDYLEPRKNTEDEKNIDKQMIMKYLKDVYSQELEDKSKTK